MPVPAGTITDDEDMVEIWADNWDALTAFLAVETQWQVAVGFGAMIWIGLNYVALDVVMRRRGFDDAVFAAVQDMERAALDVFARAS